MKHLHTFESFLNEVKNLSEKKGNGEIAVLKSDKAKAEKIMADLKLDYEDVGPKDSSSMNYYMIPNTDWDVLNKIGAKVKLQSMTVKESLNEGLDPKKVEKLLDDLHAQDQKVKDSNYNMAEIKKLDAIEREAVKMGVAKAIGSAWHKDKTPKEVHSKYKEYGYEWMGESVNEAMTFDEVKDKYIENPYGIGAQRIEFIDKSGGNSRMLVFRHDNRYDRDKIEAKLRSMGFPAKKLSKSVGDKAFMYPYELTLQESLNEAADLSPLDGLLTKNGWKEVSTRSSPGYPSGTIRYFDYENSAKRDLSIRIVDSPMNGVYVELYKDDEQINTDPQRKRNQPPKYIQTIDDLIAAAKKFLNVKLNESSLDEGLPSRTYGGKPAKFNPKPFAQVKAGDIAYVLGDPYTEYTVVATAVGKDFVKKLKKYDESGIVTDMQMNPSNYGLEAAGWEELELIAVATDSPRDPNSVYTYGDDGAWVNK